MKSLIMSVLFLGLMSSGAQAGFLKKLDPNKHLKTSCSHADVALKNGVSDKDKKDKNLANSLKVAKVELPKSRCGVRCNDGEKSAQKSICIEKLKAGFYQQPNSSFYGKISDSNIVVNQEVVD